MNSKVDRELDLRVKIELSALDNMARSLRDRIGVLLRTHDYPKISKKNAFGEFEDIPDLSHIKAWPASPKELVDLITAYDLVLKIDERRRAYWDVIRRTS